MLKSNTSRFALFFFLKMPARTPLKIDKLKGESMVAAWPQIREVNHKSRMLTLEMESRALIRKLCRT
jgi:hypothetical protein